MTNSEAAAGLVTYSTATSAQHYFKPESRAGALPIRSCPPPPPPPTPPLPPHSFIENECISMFNWHDKWNLICNIFNRGTLGAQQRQRSVTIVVCWLLNVPATCKCISGTDSVTSPFSINITRLWLLLTSPRNNQSQNHNKKPRMIPQVTRWSRWAGSHGDGWLVLKWPLLDPPAWEQSFPPESMP